MTGTDSTKDKLTGDPTTLEIKHNYFSVDIECPYKDRCRSYNSFQCKKCKHNKNKKKDYFERDNIPFTFPGTTPTPRWNGWEITCKKVD